MRKRCFKFLNRNGTITIRQMLIHLGMFAIIALIYFLLQAKVKSIERDTEFQKIFLSRDMALLTNTLYSAPGNVEYVYSFDKLDLSKFKFEFKELSATDDKPIVRVETDNLAKNYPYGKNFQANEANLVFGAKSIKFSKSDSRVMVTKNE